MGHERKDAYTATRCVAALSCFSRLECGCWVVRRRDNWGGHYWLSAIVSTLVVATPSLQRNIILFNAEPILIKRPVLPGLDQP